jgi:hypothetical protein
VSGKAVIRAGRGSLTGRWPPRADKLPNLRGSITLEQPLPAGTTHLWLAGWTKQIGDAEYLSLVVEHADKAPRRRKARNRSDTPDEPIGKFRDREPP